VTLTVAQFFTPAGAGTAQAATTTCTPNGAVQECTVTFEFSGAAETWTVPAGVTSATFDLYGAQGGAGGGGQFYRPGSGGGGAEATATLSVTPGTTYQINVGGAGGNGTAIRDGAVGAGGFNGGAPGGSGDSFSGGSGGGGGGASDVRTGNHDLADRLLVASGGGGGGGAGGGGGGGGGYYGGGGGSASANPNSGGGGGTQSSGGLGGISTTGGCGAGGNGSSGTGGAGGEGNKPNPTSCGGSPSGGGGAGGGSTGENGGGGYGGTGGGGGSSYGPTDVVFQSGVRAGNGLIIITFTVSPDTTAPVITPTVIGTLGANGWYTSDVNVTWSVVDNESAISSQTGCGAQSVTSDTSGVTFTCSATSAGGNSSQSVTIKRDATAPTITFVNRTAANSNGWNNSAVTVNWSCSDTTSGAVTASSSQTVSSEGANQSVTGSCTDNAGNSASDTQSGINIDKTAPTISAAATTQPNANGWYNGNVTVQFTCDDNLSGVVNCPADETLSSEGTAVASTAQTITDQAGNSSAASNVVTVKIDKTAPTISAAATGTPNANGWYNSNVTVQFTCADGLSGVASCPNDEVLSSEGAAVASTAQTVVDQAGNSSAASNVVTVQIDKTAPIVTVTGVSNGASYILGSVPTAGCSTTDALSGVATQATISVTGGNPDGTGSFTATCSGATDNAGNSGSASATYSVIYNWTGFFQPVDNLPVVNTVNAGQAIPVKFSLGGDYGLNIFAAGYPASQQVSCGGGGGGSSSPIEETVTAGNSSLQYDPGTQRYSYVWKTDKTWAGTCRQLIVKLIDGTEHVALFQFNGNGNGRSAESVDAEGDVTAAQQQIFLPLVNNQ
jgi:hypothetical protein